MKRLLIILLTAAGLNSGVAEDILPIEHLPSRYAQVWNNSPFNREVVKYAGATLVSNFGKTLALEGIVHDDRLGPIAYVRDLVDNQPIMVTRTESLLHPYTVVSANQVNDPRESRVTITNGQESAEIGYISNLMTKTIEQPARKATSTSPSSPGASGTQPTASSDPPAPKVAGTPPTPAATPGNTATEATEATPRRRRILLPNRAQN
tara:strand:+ start:1768 stop:2388 length:621 start_codon:yes stop_codon:yes gene_type:complete